MVDLRYLNSIFDISTSRESYYSFNNLKPLHLFYFKYFVSGSFKIGSRDFRFFYIFRGQEKGKRSIWTTDEGREEAKNGCRALPECALSEIL